MDGKNKFSCSWGLTQLRARQRPKRDTDPPSTEHTLLFLTHKFLLSKCGLCGPQTGNTVKFEITLIQRIRGLKSPFDRASGTKRKEAIRETITR